MLKPNFEEADGLGTTLDYKPQILRPKIEEFSLIFSTLHKLSAVLFKEWIQDFVTSHFRKMNL